MGNDEIRDMKKSIHSPVQMDPGDISCKTKECFVVNGWSIWYNFNVVIKGKL